MSPDNGRPLHHLLQTNSQRSIDGNNETVERIKPNSRTQVINNDNFLEIVFVYYRIPLLMQHNNHKSKLFIYSF
jgi:hypothetical protein